MMPRDDVFDEFRGRELPQLHVFHRLALGDGAPQLVKQGVQLDPTFLRRFGDTQLPTATEIDTMPLQHGGAGGMFEHQACDGLARIRRLEEVRASLCHEPLLSTRHASRASDEFRCFSEPAATPRHPGLVPEPVTEWNTWNEPPQPAASVAWSPWRHA